MSQIKKIIYIFLGSIFVLIGLIGLLLPVVPTTPFLIIAGIFYIRSSDKLYNRLIKTRVFGPHIKNYVEEKKVTHKFKVYGLVLMWIPTLITQLFFVKIWYLRLIPILFVSAITIYILKLKTKDEIIVKDETKNIN